MCSLVSANAKDHLDTKTDRLIFVTYKGGTNAAVEMWKKVSVIENPFYALSAVDGPAEQEEDADATIAWKKIVSCEAYIGANGLEKKKEDIIIGHPKKILIISLLMSGRWTADK